MKPPRDDPLEYKFCLRCAGEFQQKRLKQNEPERLVCEQCGFVFFLNPKVAAGTIVEIEGKIVLARRSIDPGYGKWVFPSGFVDRGEAVPAAAIRETREEVSLEVKINELLDVYSYAEAPVVVIVYTASVAAGELLAADECLEARAFETGEIPWDELAFPSTRDALKDYVRRYRCSRNEAGSNTRRKP